MGMCVVKKSIRKSEITSDFKRLKNVKKKGEC